MTDQQFTTEELNSEEWKTIPDYEDYEASSLGRIRRPIAARTQVKNRILRQRPNGTGYLLVNLQVNGKTLSTCAHRFIARAFLGRPSSEALQVNHKDGNKTNNRPENLEWTSPLENVRHSIEFLGVDNSGDNHGEAKLTAAQVIEIHNLRMAGRSPNEIGKLYDVCGETIRRIIQRRAYLSITANLPINYPPLSKNEHCRNPTGGKLLTEQQENQIRELDAQGVGIVQIARIMNLPLGTVGSFKYRKIQGKCSKRHKTSNNPLQVKFVPSNETH